MTNRIIMPDNHGRDRRHDSVVETANRRTDRCRRVAGRPARVGLEQEEADVKAKLLSEQGDKTFALIFDTGDEVMAGLLGFAKEKRLAGSHFTAIGACSDVTLGYFDWQKKDYRKIPVREQVEVLSLAGDIA